MTAILYTNDLKKGDMIVLRSGWKARIEDNKKGNIRLCTVFGSFTEMGSVYAYDIKAKIEDNNMIPITHTEKQLKLKDTVRALF